MKMNWINKIFLLISEQPITDSTVKAGNNVILLACFLSIIYKYKSPMTLSFRIVLPGVINDPQAPVLVTHIDR